MSDFLKRGNILWESSRMFLPEHKQALLQRKKQLEKIEKPLLDEQALQEIDCVVMHALANQLKVTIDYWTDGMFKQLQGTIKKVNNHQRIIIVKNHEKCICLSMDCIVTVKWY